MIDNILPPAQQYGDMYDPFKTPWYDTDNEYRVYNCILAMVESSPHYTYTELLDSLIGETHLANDKIEWTLRRMLFDPDYHGPER